jgi:uncharacterized protein YuzE
VVRFPELASTLTAELEAAGNRPLADELRVATVRSASFDAEDDVAYISLNPLRDMDVVERHIVGERYGRTVPTGNSGAIYLDLDNLGRVIGVQIFFPTPELQAEVRASADG